MKKNFKSFIIIWAAGLVLFNLCAFLIPTETRFTPYFWSGYGFITVAFVLQLGIAYFAFKEVNKEKLFLSIPTITVSFITLVCTAIAGAVAMAVEGIPEWVGSVVCFACVGFGVAGILLSKTAGDMVAKKDDKIKTQTFFIKSLTVDADTLVAQAKEPEIKAEVKKVYEAIRYSDPMSNDALAGTEAQITLKFNELQTAIKDNNAEAVKTISNELLILIKDRNSKCKLLK